MRIKTILFITSFLPVAVFKTIARVGSAGLAQAKVATVVGFVLAGIQFILANKFIKHTSYLERVFLAYLALGTLCVYLAPAGISGIFVDNSTTILYFVLFLTTLIPQLFGYEPFTYAIAKQWQPESVWQTPQFRTVNLHITYLFSGLFFAATLSCYLGQGKPLYSIVIPLALILGIGIPFSRKYPAYYVGRQKTPASVNAANMPATTRELIASMPNAFDAAVAGDLKADIQFRISGGESFAMFLSISDGICSVHEGEAAAPAVTVISPADVWMKIARGELNGPKAFMEGLYKGQGDINLLVKMRDIFAPQVK